MQPTQIRSVATATVPATIPVIRPWMDSREAHAVERVIESGWVTQGPEVAAFEREFAASVEAEHACAVSNCTTALHLALLVAGVKAGDEVITVSHSMIATANAVRYCGGLPVFVDIDADTFNIDPSKIEKEITERTRAILCVHQMGMPCDLAAIVEIGRQYNLPVIEDAACAAGSEILWDGHWEPIGRPHGDIACFSFHPRKLVTTGDGGMLTTNRSDWDEQFRMLRHHGMSASDTVRHQSRAVIFESYDVIGFNYRMSDLQAAVGRVQLERLPAVITRRREMANRYCELLGEIPGIGLPVEPEWARSNWQSFCIRLPGWSDQARVMQALLDAGISTRRGIMCAHREPPYANSEAQNARHGLLPESERAQDTGMILPMYHQMTSDEQEYIASMLLQVCS